MGALFLFPSCAIFFFLKKVEDFIRQTNSDSLLPCQCFNAWRFLTYTNLHIGYYMPTRLIELLQAYNNAIYESSLDLQDDLMDQIEQEFPDFLAKIEEKLCEYHWRITSFTEVEGRWLIGIFTSTYIGDDVWEDYSHYWIEEFSFEEPTEPNNQ